MLVKGGDEMVAAALDPCMKVSPCKALMGRLSYMGFVREEATDRLARLSPTFTSRQAREEGLSWRDLYALRDSEEIAELARGVYRKASAPETAHVDLLAVAARVPQAVICLESALALHDLTDEVPSEIRIAVPRNRHVPRFDYPPLSVSRFDPHTFEVGVELFEIAPGEMIRVYSAARSVVDAIRLRRFVGEVTGLRALRLYVRRRGAQPAELLRLARLLRAEGRVRSALDAVTA
ncbi:type IV toxin-antitoxin system AbiEi family antitoxin domain-containing protein [Actinoallomurus soli]|uniref:type IV toxin-antitoxin system AbiEi family antitoxin domain-containing protein n=1 Tax=Actinoallomurus soli TaxID=2952535 RepID=UPI0020934493|nr:type IV toxin-antitoxin system AbiEi family antitoxin domain-containing protein [Actinoallomurus soli]MCO5971797.1 type IV toxin-antitoxin system AbiEi family antitoxin domain-containing protein [Actinoallomurus soli]